MLEIKTIKIDEEVYLELSKRIRDFSDTPNTVLRRVLNIDYLSQDGSERKVCGAEKKRSKNIKGRIEGDRQRLRLKNQYGELLDDYPILYHAGWPLQGGEIQKYSFGMPLRRFVVCRDRGGFVGFICGKAEETLFIPCDWIEKQLKSRRSSTSQLKFNIPVNDGTYYWMNKKDGIVINCFLNQLP